MKNKILSAIMTMMVIVGLFVPMEGYADDKVKISTFSAGIYPEHTEKGQVVAVIENISNQDLSGIQLYIDKAELPGSITQTTSFDGTLKQNSPVSISWDADLIGMPMGKGITIRLDVKDASNQLLASKQSVLQVTPNDESTGNGKANLPIVEQKDYTYKPDPNVNYNPQMKLEVVSPSGGLKAGATNTMQLKIKNTGNAPFNKVIAGITLAEKMSLQNASVEQDLGSMSRTGESVAKFPVHIDSTHTGGNIPITFTVKGTDPTGKEATFAITEYVTVNAGTSQVDKLEIINVQNPQSVAMDQTFSLKFAVRNNSSETAKNIKVTVEPTAPVVNKSKNIFIISLAGGESKAFDIQLFAAGNAEVQSQNYPIKITAETTDKEPIGISQYAGVFVNGDNKTKTVPQIIITNYTYGGSSVVANEVFPLSLVLKNTNSSQTLRNIKVSLTADEGIFIPHNSSNSFYIDKIGANASIQKTIQLMTKPDAPEKTVSINVDMSYEDSKGNPVSVKDIISVPVIQQRKIVIDDVNPIDPIFQGEDSNVSVQYYNMGKSTLNNLVITAESEQLKFTQNPKSFIGKFEPGKSGSYDFTFIAEKTGEVKGKLLITFEDSNGKEVKMEKAFAFVVEEPIMPPENEMTNEIPEPEKGGKMKKVLIGVGVATAIVVAGIVIKKIRKKKFDDSLDIGNE